MPRASPRALSNSFPKVSQFTQVAQHGRTRATPPCRYFCSGLSKTFIFHFSFHVANASGKSQRALKFVAEDFAIQAGGPVRPYACHAAVPLFLLRPAQNMYFSI